METKDEIQNSEEVVSVVVEKASKKQAAKKAEANLEIIEPGGHLSERLGKLLSRRGYVSGSNVLSNLAGYLRFKGYEVSEAGASSESLLSAIADFSGQQKEFFCDQEKQMLAWESLIARLER